MEKFASPTFLNWRLLLIVVLGALLLFLGRRMADSVSPREAHLTLTTGSEGGLYRSLGKEMAEVIHREHPHINIDVVTSSGSQENIKKLATGEAHMALVQNDTEGNTILITLRLMKCTDFHQGQVRYL